MVYRADTTSSRLFKVLREKIDQVGFLICTSAALGETNPLHLLVDGIVLCNAALQQQQLLLVAACEGLAHLKIEFSIAACMTSWWF